MLVLDVLVVDGLVRLEEVLLVGMLVVDELLDGVLVVEVLLLEVLVGVVGVVSDHQFCGCCNVHLVSRFCDKDRMIETSQQASQWRTHL